MFIHDLQSARLGDARCTARLMRFAEGLAGSPAAALPAIFSKEKDLVGVYRLANRSRTTMDAILQPHVDQTAVRCRERSRVLVIHDTTEFAFADTGLERTNLSQLSAQRQGFYDHVSLALSVTGEEREVLGVLSHLPYVHASQVDEESAVFWADRGGLFDNEHLRWLEAVHRCEDALDGAGMPERVHVADREGDSYELLHCLQQRGAGFVIRCAHRHRLVFSDQNDIRGVEEALQERAVQGARTRVISVPLERMTRSGEGRKLKGPGNGPPPRREALVTLRWTEVVLAPSSTHVRASDPEPRDLVYAGLVEVIEPDPPKGFKPASWLLYHSESITSEDQAWQVVDDYRARWVIEEYFKVLKTGLSYEKRQLTTAHGLLNVLAVSAIVACDILCLRDYDRYQPDRPACDRFDAEVIEYVQRKHPQLVPSARPTMRELLAAVAREGGHLKQNGPPGWQVLYRGYAAILHGVQILRQLGISLADTPTRGRA